MENEKLEGNLNNGGDDDLKDEEKVEKFFALIRNFREARKRRKDELNELQEKNKSNKIKKIGHGEQSSWIPKFEWQDFTEEIEFIRPPAIFPSPCNKKEDKNRREEDDGLDLKLAL